jgi:hypothetical protein
MAKTATKRVAETISLDELIATSSRSAIRTFREFELDKRIFNPRIWVGIWIEPFGPGELEIPTGAGPSR